MTFLFSLSRFKIMRRNPFFFGTTAIGDTHIGGVVVCSIARWVRSSWTCAAMKLRCSSDSFLFTVMSRIKARVICV